MIDFWIGAVVLLLCALAFLLVPVLRSRTVTADVDRTALNVSLYQERVAELQAQCDAGALTAEQFERGCAEASRELLDDAERAQQHSSSLGRKVPILLAVALPVLGLGLYLYWGALDKVELSREFATPPSSLEQLVDRLERATNVQPDSLQSWYLLGRAYISAERPTDAAEAFEQAIELGGRDPQVLGQLAQARYFANGKKWDDSLQALADEALAGAPFDLTTLSLLGIAAFESQRYADAVTYWQRLIEVLPANDPTREMLQSGVDAAKQRMTEAGESVPEVPVEGLKIRVELAPELLEKVAPSDTVFISARAANGPAMPLAVHRLTVAQLPVELVFSDKDAMMPELKLSSVDQVILQARISRSGDARQGEWFTRSEPVSSSSDESHLLVIDQPDVR